MSMMLVNKSVAHPWECDNQGHLTTRFYVAMFDDASYHFLATAFGAPEDGLGWADVRHEIDYVDEVHAGELLDIHAGLVKLGGRSVTVRYEMRKSNGSLAASLTSVSVLFDLAQRKSAPLTDSMRETAVDYLLAPSA